MSLRAAAAAAACVATLAAGCGGSGDGSWGQRADAICDRAERAVRAIAPPEDITDLDRAMVRASEEVRAAIAGLRELEPSDDERRRAQPFLDDLDVVEERLERISDATSAGERRPIEREGRRLRLDSIDFAAHAEDAGLTRCGREELGVAAAGAVMVPAFAQWLARTHGSFLVAERALARRFDPEGGAPAARGRYWVAVWELIERFDSTYAEFPADREDVAQEYFGTYQDLRERADYFSSRAKGELPQSDTPFTERQGRRSVRTFEAAGFALLEQLGPAGEAQLRILRGEDDDEGGSEGQPS